MYPGTAIRARIDERTTTWRAVGAWRQMTERGADAVVGAVDVRPDEIGEPVASRVVLAVRAADPARRHERVERAVGTLPPPRTRARPPPARGCRTGKTPTWGPTVAAVSSRSSRRLATSETRAPSRARRSAIARPIPVPAPVTTTCLPVILSPLFRNLRTFRGQIPLACDCGLQSVDCRCAEHGTRLGRSSPGGPYAEAEGQSGKWTKAHPARRIHGPVLSRAHDVQRKSERRVKKNSQRAHFSSLGA